MVPKLALNTAEARCVDLQRTLNSTQLATDSMTEELNNVSAQLKEREDDCRKLRIENFALEGKVEDQQAKLKKSFHKISELQGVRLALDESELQLEKYKLQVDASVSKDQFDDLEMRCTFLTDKLLQVTHNMNDTEDDLARAKSATQSIEKELDDTEKILLQKLYDLGVADKQLTELESQSQGYLTQALELAATNESLRSDLDETRGSLESTSRELCALQAQVVLLQDLCNSLQDRLDSTEKNLDDATNLF